MGHGRDTGCCERSVPETRGNVHRKSYRVLCLFGCQSLHLNVYKETGIVMKSQGVAKYHLKSHLKLFYLLQINALSIMQISYVLSAITCFLMSVVIVQAGVIQHEERCIL